MKDLIDMPYSLLEFHGKNDSLGIIRRKTIKMIDMASNLREEGSNWTVTFLNSEGSISLIFVMRNYN